MNEYRFSILYTLSEEELKELNLTLDDIKAQEKAYKLFIEDLKEKTWIEYMKKVRDQV